MKKYIIVLFSVVLIMCGLTGCASDESKAMKALQGKWNYEEYCEADMNGDIDEGTAKYLSDAWNSKGIMSIDKDGYIKNRKGVVSDNPIEFYQYDEETNAYEFVYNDYTYFMIADEPDTLYQLYFFPSEKNKSIADSGNFYARVMSEDMMNKLASWGRPSTQSMYPDLPDYYLSEGVQIWIYKLIEK